MQSPGSGSWNPKDHPNLKLGNHEITSAKTRLYNCIAWAAERTNKNYWPEEPFWPKGIRNQNDVQSFVEFYQLFGYVPCNNGEHETGFDKVAIFVDVFGKPTHAARQLADGKWTSKLGKVEDISHRTLHEVEDGIYGKAVQLLKRERKSS